MYLVCGVRCAMCNTLKCRKRQQQRCPWSLCWNFFLKACWMVETYFLKNQMVLPGETLDDRFLRLVCREKVPRTACPVEVESL